MNNIFTYNDIMDNPTSTILTEDTITHRIIKTEEEFDALEKSWNLLCERTNSFVFQTYDWNRTWWKYFGVFSKLQIFVLYDEETVVGIAPIFCDQYTLFGRNPYTYLRMIGSTTSKTEEGVLLGQKAYSDYLQFLIHDEYVTPFYYHLIKFLKNEVRYDELILDEIPEHSSTLTILEKDFASFGYDVSINDASKTSFVVPNNNWDDYLNNLSRNERKNVRKCIRTFDSGETRIFRIERLDVRDDFQRYLERFIVMHQEQWNKAGFPGTFAEKCMSHFFLETSMKLHDEESLRLYALLPEGAGSNENYVAMSIVIVDSTRMYLQHSAMDISSDFLQYGPGKTLNTANILEAVQSQKIFDFLRGDEAYKFRLANHINQNKTIIVSIKSGHRRLYRWIVMLVQRVRKRLAIERVRKQIKMKQSPSITGWCSYLYFILTRLIHRRSHALKRTDKS